MNICILLTSVGGLVSPGIIENLRAIPDVCRIIGVDALPNAIGFYMVDKSYVVPAGDTSDYIKIISEIVKEENVNIIIPCSDEEVLTLSQYKKSFKERGIAVLCSPFEITATTIDKGSMLMSLKEHGLAYPNFYFPTSTNELIQFARQLGYPDRPIVAKPRRGRGGRGVKILREDINIINARDANEMKLEWFAEAIGSDLNKFVLMEYLPGEDYSIDALADNGRLLYVVPRKRIKSILGPSQIGETFWDPTIVAIVKSVVNVFGFDSNVNIQLKCSVNDETPMIYEINPRVSGTIVASTAVGIDLLRYGMMHALGLDLPRNTLPRQVRMIRYLKEYFVEIPKM